MLQITFKNKHKTKSFYQTNNILSLNDVVLHGLKDEVKKATETALESQDGLTIVNDILIPALDQIGKDYETGKIFLPQLIQSAEASKIAFDVIKQTFKTTKSSKGPVLIATVMVISMILGKIL